MNQSAGYGFDCTSLGAHRSIWEGNPNPAQGPTQLKQMRQEKAISLRLQKAENLLIPNTSASDDDIGSRVRQVGIAESSDYSHNGAKSGVNDVTINDEVQWAPITVTINRD